MTIQELNKRVNTWLSHRVDYNIRSVISAICANELQLLLSKAELVQDKQMLTYMINNIFGSAFTDIKFGISTPKEIIEYNIPKIYGDPNLDLSRFATKDELYQLIPIVMEESEYNGLTNIDSSKLYYTYEE